MCLSGGRSQAPASKKREATISLQPCVSLGRRELGPLVPRNVAPGEGHLGPRPGVGRQPGAHGVAQVRIEAGRQLAGARPVEALRVEARLFGGEEVAARRRRVSARPCGMRGQGARGCATPPRRGTHTQPRMRDASGASTVKAKLRLSWNSFCAAESHAQRLSNARPFGAEGHCGAARRAAPLVSHAQRGRRPNDRTCGPIQLDARAFAPLSQSSQAVAVAPGASRDPQCPAPATVTPRASRCPARKRPTAPRGWS